MYDLVYPDHDLKNDDRSLTEFDLARITVLRMLRAAVDKNASRTLTSARVRTFLHASGVNLASLRWDTFRLQSGEVRGSIEIKLSCKDWRSITTVHI